MPETDGRKFFVFDDWESADRAERIISKWVGYPILQDGKFNETTRFSLVTQRNDGKWIVHKPLEDKFIQGIDVRYTIEERQDDWFPVEDETPIPQGSVDRARAQVGEIIRAVEGINDIDHRRREMICAYLKAAEALLQAPDIDRPLVRDVLKRCLSWMRDISTLAGIAGLIEKLLAII